MGNPFIHHEPVIPPIFAGRKRELAILQKALFEDRDSIVIYGNDAIGKSSLVSTLYTDMSKKVNEKFFPVRINAFDFIKAVDEDFLGIATHQICAAIWTRLMNRKYSELLEDSLFVNQKKISNSPEEKSIKRIFRIVTSQKLIAIGRTNKKIGGKFYIEGEISSATDLTNERKPLAPFEFIHLLDELNDIIESYNYNSILVFCDELNHLPEKTNTDILRNYFGVFSSKKIQFVIVSINPELDRKSDSDRLIDSFNYKLYLDTFKSIDDAKELVLNVLTSNKINLTFDLEAYEILFDITAGHPWFIQKICNEVFKISTKLKKSNVDSQMLVDSSKLFSDEMKIYRERTAAGLPFRKYNLFY